MGETFKLVRRVEKIKLSDDQLKELLIKGTVQIESRMSLIELDATSELKFQKDIFSLIMTNQEIIKTLGESLGGGSNKHWGKKMKEQKDIELRLFELRSQEGRCVDDVEICKLEREIAILEEYLGDLSKAKKAYLYHCEFVGGGSN